MECIESSFLFVFVWQLFILVVGTYPFCICRKANTLATDIAHGALLTSRFHCMRSGWKPLAVQMNHQRGFGTTSPKCRAKSIAVKIEIEEALQTQKNCIQTNCRKAAALFSIQMHTCLFQCDLCTFWFDFSISIFTDYLAAVYIINCRCRYKH